MSHPKECLCDECLPLSSPEAEETDSPAPVDEGERPGIREALARKLCEIFVDEPALRVWQDFAPAAHEILTLLSTLKGSTDRSSFCRGYMYGWKDGRSDVDPRPDGIADEVLGSTGKEISGDGGLRPRIWEAAETAVALGVRIHDFHCSPNGHVGLCDEVNKMATALMDLANGDPASGDPPPKG